MADGSLLLIFRSLDTGELQARKAALLGQMTTLSSQSIGNKSLTRDLRELKVQLEAVVFVLKERTSSYDDRVVVDFSDKRPTPPSGTTELL